VAGNGVRSRAPEQSHHHERLLADQTRDDHTHRNTNTCEPTDIGRESGRATGWVG